MDHYQVRFPTNVEDVARVLYDISRGPILRISPELSLIVQISTSTFPPFCTTPRLHPP
jgi:hypothetical protein